MADERITDSKRFPQSYHLAWLEAHPWRSYEWLQERIRDGFHVHHVDGDHGNDEPTNLVLIDGHDHMALHGIPLRDGIERWRNRPRRKTVAVKQHSVEGEKAYALKVELDCQWKELAQRFYGGVKPDGSKIWAAFGQALMGKARSYARRANKPWPPAAIVVQGSIPTEVDIAAVLSRQ